MVTVVEQVESGRGKTSCSSLHAFQRGTNATLVLMSEGGQLADLIINCRKGSRERGLRHKVSTF